MSSGPAALPPGPWSTWPRAAPGRPRRTSPPAGRLFAGTTQELESAYLVHNQAIVAFRSGDLPTALSCLDEAAGRYSALDVPSPDLTLDRCAVLLAAGLPRDALSYAEQAIRDAEERTRGQSTKRAELLLAAATCALAAEQPQVALARAQAARRLFRAQHRARWRAHAGFLVLSARFAQGGVSAPLLRAASQLALQLDRLGSVEAPQAHLLAGRIALRLGRPDEARRQLTAAARSAAAARPTPGRPAGWPRPCWPRRRPIRARCCTHAGAAWTCWTRTGSRWAPRSCAPRRHRGRALSWPIWPSARRCARAGPGCCCAGVSAGGPLPWPCPRSGPAMTRNRGRSRRRPGRCGQPPGPGSGPGPPGSRTPPAAAAAGGGGPRPGDARPRHPRSIGRPQRGRPRDLDADALLAELKGTRLVQIVAAGTALHVLVCGNGRVRHRAAGQAAQALRATELARSGLRRAAHSGPGRGPSADSAFALLAATGRQLEQTPPGSTPFTSRDGPVVIVPPGKVPRHPVGAAALAPVPGGQRGPVGPGLASGPGREPPARPARRPGSWPGPGYRGRRGARAGAAVRRRHRSGRYGRQQQAAAQCPGWRLAGAHRGARHVPGRQPAVLLAADGRWPCSPSTTSQPHRAPHRIILPSCDSGGSPWPGADELLGLTSSLLPLGTAGVVASIAPLNDHAAVPLMLSLHQHLRSGQTLAGSLCTIRRQVSDDPVLLGAAWSLMALGAG